MVIDEIAEEPFPSNGRESFAGDPILGGLFAVVGAFPVAALMALVFRFPVPYAGYLSGFQAVVPALFAVLFYGLMGGFVVLAAAGAVFGAVCFRRLRASEPLMLKFLLILLCVNLPLMLLMAVLDKIIGPF